MLHFGHLMLAKGGRSSFKEEKEAAGRAVEKGGIPETRCRGLSGRFTSRELRVQVFAWGRRWGLARFSCRFATCLAGVP